MDWEYCRLQNWGLRKEEVEKYLGKGTRRVQDSKSYNEYYPMGFDLSEIVDYRTRNIVLGVK